VPNIAQIGIAGTDNFTLFNLNLADEAVPFATLFLLVFFVVYLG